MGNECLPDRHVIGDPNMPTSQSKYMHGCPCMGTMLSNKIIKLNAAEAKLKKYEEQESAFLASHKALGKIIQFIGNPAYNWDDDRDIAEVAADDIIERLKNKEVQP